MRSNWSKQAHIAAQHPALMWPTFPKLRKLTFCKGGNHDLFHLSLYLRNVGYVAPVFSSGALCEGYEMTANHTTGPWYTSNSGSIQGIVIAEQSGANIAVTYAVQDAPLVAAAPELLAALEDAEFLLRKAAQVAGPMQDSFARSASDARAAIAKAQS
jgi:hypothetical protein